MSLKTKENGCLHFETAVFLFPCCNLVDSAGEGLDTVN